MSEVLIVGISGKIGAGKDAFADFFLWHATQQGYKVVRRAFADALKEEYARYLSCHTEEQFAELLTVFGCENATAILNQVYGVYKFWPGLKRRAYQGAVTATLEECHYRPMKDRHHRLALQWWGTEYRRKGFRDTWWLEKLEHHIDGLKKLHAGQKLAVLIPDDRFPNEQNFLLDMGAKTVRINRPLKTSKSTVPSHASETSLDSCTTFHKVIQNDGTLTDLDRAAWLCASLWCE